MGRLLFLLSYGLPWVSCPFAQVRSQAASRRKCQAANNDHLQSFDKKVANHDRNRT